MSHYSMQLICCSNIVPIRYWLFEDRLLGYLNNCARCISVQYQIASVASQQSYCTWCLELTSAWAWPHASSLEYCYKMPNPYRDDLNLSLKWRLEWGCYKTFDHLSPRRPCWICRGPVPLMWYTIPSLPETDQALQDSDQFFIYKLNAFDIWQHYVTIQKDIADVYFQRFGNIKIITEFHEKL